MNYEYPKAIEDIVNLTYNMADVLDKVVINTIGEDYAWVNHVGSTSIPDEYKNHCVAGERLARLWELREEANSLLLAESDHSIKRWAETVSEVNEECKAQRKLVTALERTCESLHSQIINLSGDYHRLKTDALDRFRAIKMLVDASIRNGNIGLNHRVRDERLDHLGDVIVAQINEIGMSTLRSYDDDF